METARALSSLADRSSNPTVRRAATLRSSYACLRRFVFHPRTTSTEFGATTISSNGDRSVRREPSPIGARTSQLHHFERFAKTGFFGRLPDSVVAAIPRDLAKAAARGRFSP